jgi:hypothetical protein
VLQTEPTLHDFVMKLLTQDDLAQAFDLDPTHALASAGLSDVSPQDVMDAIPLVLDFASSSAGEFNPTLNLTASPEGAGFNVSGATQDAAAKLGIWASPTGASGAGGVETALGGGSFVFGGGMADDGAVGVSGSGEVHFAGHSVALPPLGFDTDSLGKGGDLATGTVAGMITQGAGSLASVLTQGAGTLNSSMASGAGMLGEHLTTGAATAAGMVTDGAHTLSSSVPDMGDLNTSSLPQVGDLGHLPAVPALPSLPDLGHLPLDLPDLGSLPQLPDLGSLPSLPDLGSLPQLPDLGSLPQLPVNLPGLPDAGHLPAVPALPSVPGAGLVQDTVGGLTSHVPVVDDLTHGLTDHLPLGH